MILAHRRMWREQESAVPAPVAADLDASEAQAEHHAPPPREAPKAAQAAQTTQRAQR